MKAMNPIAIRSLLNQGLIEFMTPNMASKNLAIKFQNPSMTL